MLQILDLQSILETQRRETHTEASLAALPPRDKLRRRESRVPPGPVLLGNCGVPGTAYSPLADYLVKTHQAAPYKPCPKPSYAGELNSALGHCILLLLLRLVYNDKTGMGARQASPFLSCA
jgi:hypothetical protein